MRPLDTGGRGAAVLLGSDWCPRPKGAPRESIEGLTDTPFSPSGVAAFYRREAVMLVGQGNKFELWNKDNWDGRMDQGGGFGPGGLPPELEGFSL